MQRVNRAFPTIGSLVELGFDRVFVFAIIALTLWAAAGAMNLIG